MDKFAKIIVEVNNSEVDRVFDYAVPDFLNVFVGDRVLVPFGQRQIEGYVIDLSDNCSCDESKVKPILAKLDDFTAISPELIDIMHKMTKEFYLKYVDVLRLFIPSELRNGKVKIKTKKIVSFNKGFDVSLINFKANAKNQIALLEYLQQNNTSNYTQLADMFSSSALKKFESLGIITILSEEQTRVPNFIKKRDTEFVHTAEQQRAIDAIKFNEANTYVLHGVTGSGKTEVYMSLISSVLSQGKTAIMLVPEISLTPQVLSSFKARFGGDVALLHSGLSAGEKYDEWRRLLLGQAKIAVGARSAIFAPLKKVGIIIIDEEHDQSYISDSNPRFDTKDIASFRSEYNSCPLILGSATPSIETYLKAQNGEYKLLELPVRANKKPMPPVEIVDMLGEVRQGGNLMFSASLLRQLEDVVKNKKQAMLFINRRGFSSFMMCRECGYVAKCDDCDVSLVYHRDEGLLKCHYCGKKYKALTVCPNCKSSSIKQGAIGTERVVFELQKIFPDVKILRMDNDTTQGKDAHQKILKEFADTTPAFLVGTQMIAKGHDFKDVVLVGILDADQSLFHSDYRSFEKTFQLITQVAGRAGRSIDDGSVVLQTYCPKHYVYKFVANYNYKGFYEKEINVRKTSLFPPFSKIIKIIFSGTIEENVRDFAKLCYNKLTILKNEYKNDFIYLDAMKSPVAKMRNSYRYQVIMRLKLDRASEITDKIYADVKQLKSSKVNAFIEINPQNFI